MFARICSFVSATFQRRTSSIEPRSEEHTSELQSQSNLVCRLLLEKKKTPISVEALPASPASVQRLEGKCPQTFVARTHPACMSTGIILGSPAPLEWTRARHTRLCT